MKEHPENNQKENKESFDKTLDSSLLKENSEKPMTPTFPGRGGQDAQQSGLHSWRLLQERRRLYISRSALVGLSAGLIAVLFQIALRHAENSRIFLLEWLHENIPIFGWAVLPVAAGIAGAFTGWLTQRFAPHAAGSGIPHIKGLLIRARNMSWQRLLPVKFIGGLLAIGSGFSLGREGPTVQMGAAAARGVAGLLRVPRSARNQLIACGAGAGLAAAFNAPVAGFIFTIEELRRELSPLTYSMSIIATVVAAIVTQSIMGQETSFHVTGYPLPPLSILPLFIVLGLLAGLSGVLFNKGLLWLQRHSDKHVRIPTWQRAGIIGIIIGLIGWWAPEMLGTGHRTAESVLRGDYASLNMIGFVLILFAGKFALTLISYVSGVPGGIFAPILLLGSLVGLATGLFGSAIFPEIAGTPAAFAVAGMASFFAAVVRAPFTGVILVLEMTANYEQLFPLLVACMVAYVVSERLHTKPIYDALLAYDLERNAPRQTEHQEPLLIEVSVEPNSAMDGHRISEMGFPQGCLIVTIRRSGQEIIPHGKTVLRAGDHITLVAAGDVTSAFARINNLCHADYEEASNHKRASY